MEALDYGADIWSELAIYGGFVALAGYEYNRRSESDQKKTQAEKEVVAAIHTSIEGCETRLDQLQKSISALNDNINLMKAASS